MFSDVGIGPSIIQSKRGADDTYINTAWTLQVIRGFSLWIVACVIAYPISLCRPDLAPLSYLLPVAAISAAIAGFNSTNLFTLNRNLTIGRITLLDMATQITGIAVTIVWALYSPTVWSIVGGSIAATALKMIFSHRLVPGTRHQFTWDKTATTELFHFGRWIFISTIITFLAGQVDKLLLGGILGPGILGVYGFAYNIANLGPLFMRKIGNMVGFPALADLFRRDIDRFHYRLRHLRIVLVLPINAGLLLLAIIGPWLVHSIYPDKFHDAGWMLVAMAVGSLAGMVNSSYGNAHMAMGKTFRVMAVVAAQLLLMVPASLLGYYFAGQVGFVLGVASVQWLLYPVHMILAIRARIWQPALDLPVLFVAAVVGYFCLSAYVPL
jgi:O-antigen/teichoic acid export membrane protein